LVVAAAAASAYYARVADAETMGRWPDSLLRRHAKTAPPEGDAVHRYSLK